MVKEYDRQTQIGMLNRLGPFGCIQMVLNPTDDLYKLLNENKHLERVEEDIVEFEVAECNIRVAANRLAGTSVFVELVKRPDGLLGLF